MAFADRALVVGINAYPGLTDLKGAVDDAKEFHEWVTSPSGGGVDKQNAMLLTSPPISAPGSVVDDATPANEQIEKFFTIIANDADANGKQKAGKRLWMFFSGHGFAPTGLRSAVLLANATPRLVHNISAEWWAERLNEGGYFDEVILFQDACRETMPSADLTPPFLIQSRAPVQQNPMKFCALAAKNGKLALEKPFPDGRVHGVFTFALMQGLKGKARDPASGAITTVSLAGYLWDAVQSLFTADDLRNNPQIAVHPDVSASDHFELIAAAPPPQFPVQISARTPGQHGLVLDAAMRTVAEIAATPSQWSSRLAAGPI